jgi:hypothetical protein
MASEGLASSVKVCLTLQTNLAADHTRKTTEPMNADKAVAELSIKRGLITAYYGEFRISR